MSKKPCKRKHNGTGKKSENQVDDIDKILACVQQMDGAFNREMVIATLRGAKSPMLFQLGLHRLAAYGSLIRYRAEHIAQLLQTQLATGKLLETTGRYKAVKLGDKALTYLEQETTDVSYVTKLAHAAASKDIDKR